MADSPKAPPKSGPRLVRRDAEGGTVGAFILDGHLTLGRHPQCDLVVSSDSVSRRHAQVEESGGYVVLTDLGSSNGTFVNGQRIQRRSLRNGDRVTFGSVDFIYQDDPARARQLNWASAVDVLDEMAGEHMTVAGDPISDHTSLLREMAQDMGDELATKKANARLSALYRLSEILREFDTDDLEALAERILELLFEVLSAERGALLLRRETDGQFTPVAARQREGARKNGRPVVVSRTILNRVVSDRVAILSSDTQDDDRFNASDSVVLHAIRSAICAPMFGRGEVIGVIHLDVTSKSRVFTEEDLRFLGLVAGEVAIMLENRAMRREAVERERLAAVGETLAGISHNAKNLLLMIGGGGDALGQSIEKQDWEGVRDSWGVVQRGVQKLERLTREMLEISSPRELELELIDVNQLIRDQAHELMPSFEAQGCALRLQLEEGLKERLTDVEELQRVLINLLKNALEAVPEEKGEVIVTTSEQPDRVLNIVVYDNGPGVQADLVSEIFKPFFTTKGSQGTGLGLPMCRKFVESLNGRITVDSTPGKGAAFCVALPLLKQHSSPETRDTVV